MVGQRGGLKEPGEGGYAASYGPASRELPYVRAFMAARGLGAVTFHGCYFGLRARDGRLLKKPWRLASNRPDFPRLFSGCSCRAGLEACMCAGTGRKGSDRDEGSQYVYHQANATDKLGRGRNGEMRRERR